jgi:Fe2+ or Zn2+ uptake regulation protein
MRNRLAADHQFQVQSHRLVVDGVCHECRQKKRRARKRVDLI